MRYLLILSNIAVLMNSCIENPSREYVGNIFFSFAFFIDFKLTVRSDENINIIQRTFKNFSQGFEIREKESKCQVISPQNGSSSIFFCFDEELKP